MGQSGHFALQKNSETYRCRTAAKYVTDLQSEASYCFHIQWGVADREGDRGRGADYRCGAVGPSLVERSVTGARDLAWGEFE
jgi:hypothetical protein